MGASMYADHEPIFTEVQWDDLEDHLGLPKRQRQVIRHLFEGRSDKQIAEAIGIALPTVRSHLCRIYSKFDVQDRTELVLHVMGEFIHMNDMSCDDTSSDVI